MLSWLKNNWYFPLLFAGIVLAVLIGKYAPSLAEDGVPEAAVATRDSAQDTLRAEFDRAKSKSDARNEAEAPERTTDVIIAEHLEKLDAEPAPDEAAGLLAALGNLHSQKKQDYETAARYYEQLIENYPDWPGVKGVYHQLINCYTRLEDQERLRILYRKMVEVFPEESNEYQYARDALGNP